MPQHPDILSPEPERISDLTAVALVSAFLALVFAVPILQLLDDPGAAWRDARRRLSDMKAAPFRSAEPWSRRALSANGELLDILVDFEHALADDSLLAQSCRPRTQWALTRWLGAGNEKAYVGVGAWTFYRYDVDYVTGPGFLTARHGKGSHGGIGDAGAATRHGPLAAVLAFDRFLKSRGSVLLVMPVPVKPSLQAAQFRASLADAELPLQNPSFAPLMHEFERYGIRVYDPTPLLVAYSRRTGRPAYLAGDTHWRPEPMQWVAADLAQAVAALGGLATNAPLTYQRGAVDVAGLGDTATMLDLSDTRRLYGLESVTIAPVTTEDGVPWQRGRNADVMLLGDSFANIYSLPSMGWGASAGLAEQLSYFLQRPVDRIVQNDNGANATREALFARLLSDTNAPVPRVVVWEFTARELAFGDWKPMDTSSPTGQ